MKFKPRSNQLRALDECLKVLRDKNGRRELAYLPCAFGKSLLLGMLSNELKDGRLLVIAPSQELLTQNIVKAESFGVKFSTFSASLGKKETSENIIYATPKSLSYEILKDLNIKYVIWDEADFQSKPNSKFINILERLKIKSVLGVTASPVWLISSGQDGATTEVIVNVKSSFFTNICCTVQIQEMVEERYWSDIKYYNAYDNLKKNILKWNTNNSDYTEESKKSFYDACNLKEKISDFLSRLPKGEDALVFTPDIKSAEELQPLIKNSAVIHSKTPKKLRKQYLEDFDNGKITTLINCGVLLAGYDKISLKNLIDASASNSLRIFIQKYGRIIRVSEGKTFGRIIDFSGNINTFGDIRELSLEFIEGFGWGMYSGERLITGIPMNSDKVYTKEYLRNGGKINLEYVFDENNPGTEKLDFGVNKGKTVKELYYRKRHYLKYLFEQGFTHKNKELERQIKLIWNTT